jgi:hypothetical protein
MSMRIAGLAVILAMSVLMVGCAKTRINFVGPPGSVLFVEGKPHHLPASVELSRPGSSGSQRHDVSLVAKVRSTELRAKGHIDVFGYAESDLDKTAVNTCDLDEPHLAQILDGKVVVFRGQSASRQPLYDLTLVKE